MRPMPDPGQRTMAKYMWGSDNFFPMPIFMFAVMVGAALVAYALTQITTSAPAIDAGMALSATKGVVWVTLAWVCVLYNGFGNQIFLKLNKGNFTEQAAHVGERIVMNQIEQGLPFLLTMWLHCAYVDATEAASLGAMYVVLRALYGVLYSYYGTFTVLVEFTTQPMYIIIEYFIVSVLCKTVDKSLKDYLPVVAGVAGVPVLALILFGVAMVWHIIGLGWGFPTGFLMTELNHSCNKPDKSKKN